MDNEEFLVMDKVNQIARKIYSLMGYTVPENYNFYEAHHPQERLCLQIATVVWEEITGDKPDLYNEWLNK